MLEEKICYSLGMRPTKHTPLAVPLPGVTGGDAVSPTQITHGLGRKQDFHALLTAQAIAQGLDPATVLPASAQSENESDSSNAGNAIDIPVQKLVLERWDHHLARYYSTLDPAAREARELADQVVRDTLRELVAPEAVLFVPPDEFHRVHQELTKLAEAMIHDAQAISHKHSQKHAAKLPVNEESLKRGLKRNLTARKFRDRHNALFHYPGIQHCAPETGIAPVAAIDGKYGSIGAEHGRYRATLPQGLS